MTGAYKYRICKRCNRRWNVSVKSKCGKYYICPMCGKRSERYETNTTARRKESVGTVLQRA